MNPRRRLTTLLLGATLLGAFAPALGSVAAATEEDGDECIIVFKEEEQNDFCIDPLDWDAAELLDNLPPIGSIKIIRPV